MTHKDCKDKELIKMAISGDMFAFEEIYIRYRAYAFKIAKRQLKNHHMAEDVTQETFCKLLCKFHLFVGKGKFKFLLAKIVRNICKKIMKKQKMLSIDVLSKMNNEVFLVDLNQDNPIEKMIENEKVEAINAAIEKLSDVYLFIVKGYWYNDMTLLQLACKLNLSLATVESMMFEALNKMHEYLEIEYSQYTYIHITKG